MSFMGKELSVFFLIFLQLHNGDNFISQNGETNIFIKSFHYLCQLHRGKNHLCQMYMGEKKPNPQVQLFQRLTHLLACRADPRQSEFDVSILAFLFPKPLDSSGLQILSCISNSFQPNVCAVSTTGNIRVMRQWKTFQGRATKEKDY